MKKAQSGFTLIELMIVVVTSVNTVNGVITATGIAALGSVTYILTPTVLNGQVQWAATGSCAAAGLC